MTNQAPKHRILTGRIATEQSGQRLDQALAQQFSDFSRSCLQEWIKQGLVMLEGRSCRAKDRVAGGEWVEICACLEDRVAFRPQAMDLNILYRDEALLVINKPPGLVVHPAAGNPDGTLLNGLLYHDPGLAQLPRAGIVHRLDKDTTGLLVVARTLTAHKSLVEQLQERLIKREYRALVSGVMSAGGSLEAPIGRHPVHRTRMAVVNGGRPATTHYRVLERFRAHSYLQVRLETGRTHQIRVHMAHLRHPLVGDQTYAGRFRLAAGISSELASALKGFQRQALHAMRLGLKHPLGGQWLEWEAPLPDDMQGLLEMMRLDSRTLGSGRRQ